MSWIPKKEKGDILLQSLEMMFKLQMYCDCEEIHGVATYLKRLEFHNWSSQIQKYDHQL